MTTNYLLLLVLEQLLRLGRDVHVDAPVLELAVLEDEEAPLRLGLQESPKERLAGALGRRLRRAVLDVEGRAAHVAADELRVLEGLLLGLQERVLAAAALRGGRGERAVREAPYQVGLALDRAPDLCTNRPVRRVHSTPSTQQSDLRTAPDSLCGAQLYSLRELRERRPALV